MIKYVVFFFLLISISTAQQVGTDISSSCITDFDCVQGICNTRNVTGVCLCNYGWTSIRDSSRKCTYLQKSKLAAFLLSFFAGGLGADWFYLSAGNGGYIAAGVFKLLTLGGIGIWWLVDWIRILTNAFLDGQGVGLTEWNP